MSMSDYEKQRLENIKQNEELLRALEIPTTQKKTTSNVTRKHKPVIKKEPKLPSRTSARIRGEAPTVEKRELDEANIDVEQAKRLKTIDSLGTEDQNKILGLLQKTLLPNTEPKKEIKQEQDDQGRTPDQILSDQLSNLKIQHVWTTVKVTPNRINGCLFHPSDSKLLGCAVDVEGYLGFWDIKNEDEEGEPIVYQYKPHTRTVTDIHFNPSDPSQLLTSSYDGLIRTFDMNQAKFVNWNVTDSYSLTSFDLSQDGNNIWFSTSDGEIGLHDSRSKQDTTIVQARDKKVGCIHLNPVHTHLLAAASNDRTVTIWDIRMWNKKPEPLHALEHGYSATSCYWSPKGDILATTSYDDYIRLFSLNEGNDIELKSAIRHNNHTGRWVTNFRARWNTNKLNGLKTQHLIIGNMKQPIDIYSGETGKEIIQLYDDDHITAIPSVNQFHPNTQQPTILAGNASGRMVCWD